MQWNEFMLERDLDGNQSATVEDAIAKQLNTQVRQVKEQHITDVRFELRRHFLLYQQDRQIEKWVLRHRLDVGHLRDTFRRFSNLEELHVVNGVFHLSDGAITKKWDEYGAPVLPEPSEQWLLARGEGVFQ